MLGTGRQTGRPKIAPSLSLSTSSLSAPACLVPSGAAPSRLGHGRGGHRRRRVRGVRGGGGGGGAANAAAARRRPRLRTELALNSELLQWTPSVLHRTALLYGWSTEGFLCSTSIRVFGFSGTFYKNRRQTSFTKTAKFNKTLESIDRQKEQRGGRIRGKLRTQGLWAASDQALKWQLYPQDSAPPSVV